MSANDTSPSAAQAAYNPSAKQKSADKVSRIPVKVVHSGDALKKPDWIRVKASSPNSRFGEIKDILRANKLVTVCEEASCPNIGECFGNGTATFMIMGDKCTRRCPFCDVGHGRPDPLDANEPLNLAHTIATLKLRYVVITSVDRDDLRDGGAAHFVACIRQTRALSPQTQIEVLVPDSLPLQVEASTMGGKLELDGERLGREQLGLKDPMVRIDQFLEGASDLSDQIQPPTISEQSKQLGHRAGLGAHHIAFGRSDEFVGGI